MKKWSYKYVEVTDEDVDNKGHEVATMYVLNEAGEDGWELVSLIPYDDNYGVKYLMKKERPEQLVFDMSVHERGHDE